MAVMDLIFGDVHYRLGFGAQNGYLSIAGNLCGQNTQRLVHAFHKVSQNLKGRLFVSLEGLKSVDSSALNLFIREKQKLLERHCEVVFVNVPADILMLMRGADLNSAFEFVPTLQEAEAKYGYALH